MDKQVCPTWDNGKLTFSAYDAHLLDNHQGLDMVLPIALATPLLGIDIDRDRLIDMIPPINIDTLSWGSTYWQGSAIWHPY